MVLCLVAGGTAVRPADSDPVMAGLDRDSRAFTRALLPIVIAFNVLIPSSRWFWPLCVAGNLSVVASVGLLLSGLPR
jgi:hypothetical protein